MTLTRIPHHYAIPAHYAKRIQSYFATNTPIVPVLCDLIADAINNNMRDVPAIRAWILYLAESNAPALAIDYARALERRECALYPEISDPFDIGTATPGDELIVYCERLRRDVPALFSHAGADNAAFAIRARAGHDIPAEDVWYKPENVVHYRRR